MRKNSVQSSIFDQKIYQESISLPLVFRAKIYQWLDNEKDFLINDQACFSRLCELLKLPSPKYLYLKMSKDSSQAKTEGILKRGAKVCRPILGAIVPVAPYGGIAKAASFGRGFLSLARSFFFLDHMSDSECAS